MVAAEFTLAMACTRLKTFSFLKIACKCFFTVRTDLENGRDLSICFAQPDPIHYLGFAYSQFGIISAMRHICRMEYNLMLAIQRCDPAQHGIEIGQQVFHDNSAVSSKLSCELNMI